MDPTEFINKGYTISDNGFRDMLKMLIGKLKDKRNKNFIQDFNFSKNGKVIHAHIYFLASLSSASRIRFKNQSGSRTGATVGTLMRCNPCTSRISSPDSDLKTPRSFSTLTAAILSDGSLCMLSSKKTWWQPCECSPDTESKVCRWVHTGLPAHGALSFLSQ